VPADRRTARYPRLNKHHEREAAVTLKTHERRAHVPAVPGRPVVDPACWTAAEMQARDDWMHVLIAAEIADLDRAVHALDASGIDVAKIARASFDLPVLGPVLDGIADDILNGRGFAMMRGVPVDRYSRRQSAIAFFMIGLHVGVPVSQNAKGHVLGHVKDLGGTSLSNPLNRGYQTSERLPFHTDQCDVVALLCLRTSDAGGDSLLTSSVAIYNEMLQRRPDLVAALSEPIAIDRRNEIPAGKDPWYWMPVFNFQDGYLSTYWTVSYIRSAQRFEELPRHSPALVEALAMFEDLARELSFTMRMQPGDVQLLHNHVVVHSRTAYDDRPGFDNRRHLLRFWLATPGGRPLPPVFADQYAHLKPGERPAGGVVVPGTVFHAPLDAE
jgi:hypothetical protein